jgi:hypothetical protein
MIRENDYDYAWWLKRYGQKVYVACLTVPSWHLLGKTG